MTCYTCHTSWTTSCFGCHLPMIANKKLPMLHNEGLTTRNYTSYNFEVLRDDIYMLGIDGTVTKHRIAPTRSTCAVVVSSQNANRDWLYYMQQTISAEGFSGFGFSSYYPHTVRAHGNQDLHRLPRLARRRQQRLDGSAADAGNESGELHGPLRLRRRRLARDSTRFRWPSTTIRRRSSAAICTSWLTRDDYEKLAEASRRTGRGRPSRRQRSGRAVARRISLRGARQGRLPHLRRRQHRQQETSRRR